MLVYFMLHTKKKKYCKLNIILKLEKKENRIILLWPFVIAKKVSVYEYFWYVGNFIVL